MHVVAKHFRDELKWQAAVILGSVDFLGNPLGFMNDISEGVSGLIYEGNIGALVQNVTHGLSNSAAKVTGQRFWVSLVRIVRKRNFDQFRFKQERCPMAWD